MSTSICQCIHNKLDLKANLHVTKKILLTNGPFCHGAINVKQNEKNNKRKRKLCYYNSAIKFFNAIQTPSPIKNETILPPPITSRKSNKYYTL